MNNIQEFHFNNSVVRTIETNNQVWFIAKDVCNTLDIKNITQAIQNLDNDERSMFHIGRQGEVNVINESGLYALILRSNKPNAKPFRKWVTSEVLPSIRKTGSYGRVNVHMQNQLDHLKDRVIYMQDELIKYKAQALENAYKAKCTPVTKDEIEQMKDLHIRLKHPITSIARRLSRSPKTIRHYLKGVQQ